MQLVTCPHDPPYVRQCCPHLLVEPDIPDRVRSFTGAGTEYHWLCPACADMADPALVDICATCDLQIAPGPFDPAPYRGSPEIRERPSQLHFEHVDVSLNPPLPGDLVGVTAIEAKPHHWLGLCHRGELVHIDFSTRTWHSPLSLERTDEGAMFGEKRYPEAIAHQLRLADSPRPSSKLSGAPASHRLVLRDRATRLPVLLVASITGQYVAVCNRWGERGVVFDLDDNRHCLDLKRHYRAEESDFPAAFAESPAGTILIHGTAWNRLDVTQMSTLKVLTARENPVYQKGESSPHYLDYFHGGLSVSTEGNWMLDNGWVWAPVGLVATWSLASWVSGNVWESEDGPSKRRLCHRAYLWDAPVTWLDDRTVAVWGFGEDDEWMLDAVRIFDVQTGEQSKWFAGPAGNLAFDRYLFCFGESLGTSIWDVETGERLLKDETTRPIAYHRGDSSFLSISNGAFRLSRLAHDSR